VFSQVPLTALTTGAIGDVAATGDSKSWFVFPDLTHVSFVDIAASLPLSYMSFPGPGGNIQSIAIDPTNGRPVVALATSNLVYRMDAFNTNLWHPVPNVLANDIALGYDGSFVYVSTNSCNPNTLDFGIYLITIE
jgi:hypothetical protein